MIEKAELELVKSRHGVHQRVSPLRDTLVGGSQSGRGGEAHLAHTLSASRDDGVLKLWGTGECL